MARIYTYSTIFSSYILEFIAHLQTYSIINLLKIVEV